MPRSCTDSPDLNDGAIQVLDVLLELHFLEAVRVNEFETAAG